MAFYEPPKCTRAMTKGWKCRRPQHDNGPCALVPTFWNRLKLFIRYGDWM